MKRNLMERLIATANIQVTFNREQFRAYRNGEATIDEIYKMNILDKEIGKLNKVAYNTLLFMVATTIGVIEAYQNTLTVPVFNNAPLSAIDKLGNTFLGIFQGVGRWVALIMAFIELIKVIMKGNSNTSEIFGIIFKYVLIYATMFMIPWFFDVVAGAF